MTRLLGAIVREVHEGALGVWMCVCAHMYARVCACDGATEQLKARVGRNEQSHCRGNTTPNGLPGAAGVLAAGAWPAPPNGFSFCLLTKAEKCLSRLEQGTAMASGPVLRGPPWH